MPSVGIRTEGILPLLAIVLTMSFGCGSGGSSLPTVGVRGTVFLDSQPVEGATVVFGPSDAAGRTATGVTDSSGQFQLTTMSPGDGSLVGNYKVTVHKLSTTGGMSQEEYEKNYEALTTGKMQVPPVVTKNALPEIYRGTDTTPLVAEVKDTGGNQFSFELTKK